MSDFQRAIEMIAGRSLTADLDDILKMLAETVRKVAGADLASCTAYDAATGQAHWPPGMVGLKSSDWLHEQHGYKPESVIYKLLKELPEVEYYTGENDASEDKFVGGKFATLEDAHDAVFSLGGG